MNKGLSIFLRKPLPAGEFDEHEYNMAWMVTALPRRIGSKLVGKISISLDHLSQAYAREIFHDQRKVQHLAQLDQNLRTGASQQEDTIRCPSLECGAITETPHHPTLGPKELCVHLEVVECCRSVKKSRHDGIILVGDTTKPCQFQVYTVPTSNVICRRLMDR